MSFINIILLEAIKFILFMKLISINPVVIFI